MTNRSSTEILRMIGALEEPNPRRRLAEPFRERDLLVLAQQGNGAIGDVSAEDREVAAMNSKRASGRALL